MGSLNWIDVVQLLIGSGVLAQGWAAVHWAVRLESRVVELERLRAAA